MDFRKLREQTMTKGSDEAVTVNTRALIDKVLARYSSDFTTLRELIQNAADAAASTVKIRFETLPSVTQPAPNSKDETVEPHSSVLLRHVVKHHTIDRLVVTNDGQAFQESDWNRLRRIAEGNPDETKIGAFGVGFYSVFADCEEPFVISGRKTMAFYWNGNGLFTRSGAVPEGQATGDTNFVLQYRNKSTPIPDLLQVSQFLATSMTFVNLKNIELWLDDWRLISLSKTTGTAKALPISKSISTETPNRSMKVDNVLKQLVQLQAVWLDIIGWGREGKRPRPQESQTSSNQLKSFFSKFTIGAEPSKKAQKATVKSEKVRDWSSKSKDSVVLHVSTVQVQTRIPESTRKELERATKKPPPSRTSISILSSPEIVTETINKEDQDSAEIDLFTSVLPRQHGRIFIGFPTSQTTGFRCHVSAPSIIPTVERESIDLNARHVKDWNIGILRVAGIACRIVFDGEMVEMKTGLQALSEGKKRPDAAEIEKVTPQVQHLLSQYTSRESTPSSAVGDLISDAFWNCYRGSGMDILSNRGILSSSNIRIVTETLSFLDNTPILPQSIMTEHPTFIQKMFDHGLIRSMTVEDIKNDLETKALDQAQLTELLKWATLKVSQQQLDKADIRMLLDVTVAMIGDSSAGRVIQLTHVRSFQNADRIPPGVPLPPETVPFEVTRNIRKIDLERLGWEQLDIPRWVKYLVLEKKASNESSEKITQNADFAQSILQILSKQWDTLNDQSKGAVTELLSPITCMPTTVGMRRPQESYFSSVKLFDDLPIITLKGSIKEKFLKTIGVRKTIELNFVFERLMTKDGSNGAKWSMLDLIKYLVSVKSDIPSADMARLRDAAIFSVAPQNGAAVRSQKASELFEPTASNQALGLPILLWSDQYKPRSPEGRFLTELGLKANPSVRDMAQILVRSVKEGRKAEYETALNYYITQYYLNGYSNYDKNEMRSWPMVPVEGEPFPNVGTPATIFANPLATILGYRTIRKDLQTHADKFGVKAEPPMSNCIDALLDKPPTSEGAATLVFSYLSKRTADMDRAMADKLGNAEIVPIIGFGRRSEKTMTRTSPRLCYLGDPSTYGKIVPFVDFGQEGNAFLRALGSKDEPSRIDLARMIVDRPVATLAALDTQKYMDLLRRLAESRETLKRDKTLWKQLKESQCLLGYAELPVRKGNTKVGVPQSGHNSEDEDEPAFHQEWSLRKPSQLVIIDQIEDYESFREYLIAAPEERSLEDFYESLGASPLRSLVQYDKSVGPLLRDQTAAMLLQKLLVERSRLFLSEFPPGDVRHDAKWLSQNLEVDVTSSISVKKSLKNHRAVVREERSAVLKTGKPNRLLVTPRYDLFHVSKEVVPLMLKKGKQNDVLALESFLNSKLSRLKAKGYNIDRILREKERSEKEARLAEEQLREMERLNEQNKAPSTPLMADEKHRLITDHEETQRVPGAFEDSPEPQPLHSGFNNFFNKIRKQAGFQEEAPTPSVPPHYVEDGHSQLQATENRPPPVSPGSFGQGQNLSSSGREVYNDLRRAITMARPHESRNLSTRPGISVPQEAVDNYCDENEYRNLTDTDVRVSGLRFFLPTNLEPQTARRHIELATSGNGTSPYISFGRLLCTIADIYGIPQQTLHVYEDAEGKTIAFNSGGAIFCNYRFFKNLHLEASRPNAVAADVLKARAYWYVTVAHELAHNLISAHDAKHSFFMESFVTEYMAAFLSRA